MTLGGACRNLLYIDTHAGRGKHLSGRDGSPLVALTTLLGHQSKAKILQNTEVQFHFVERDEENHAALTEELKSITLPAKVRAVPECGDGFEIIERRIRELEGTGSSLAPSFIFVDPFGFKLPGALLQRLMTFPKVELFVNVIWRELDMAIQQARGGVRQKEPRNQASLFDEPETVPSPTPKAQPPVTSHYLEPSLNTVFAGDTWRAIDAPDADGRAEQCADLLRTLTKAKWGTHIRMLDNRRIRYFLLHLTNHPDGRDLMKECMWKACPSGGFYASKSDSPRTQYLIQPEPDLTPLYAWVREKLASGAKKWRELSDPLREELWREPHLNEALRQLRNDGAITAQGTFGPKQNPLISLAPK
jgi:three-Cys-motif partner protein